MSKTTEEIEYRPLEEHFKGDGYTFQLIARQGEVALFAKTKPSHNLVGYEVVIIQKHEATAWPDGRRSPAREGMPMSEAWGVKAWTPGDWHRALDMFKSRVYDDPQSYEQPARWLWPANPRVAPAKDWALDPEVWAKRQGAPGAWVKEQEEMA